MNRSTAAGVSTPRCLRFFLELHQAMRPTRRGAERASLYSMARGSPKMKLSITATSWFASSFGPNAVVP